VTGTKEAVTAYLGALNQGDPDAIASCVTDDFWNEHTSALGSSLKGRAAYRERLPQFLGRFRGLHYDIEDLLVDGERASVRYLMSCRWTDDAGREFPVLIRGMFWFAVRAGLIAHRIDYWDGTEFTRQVSV
jgi:ketosteroid isomerase-like protein